jgi:hypothetical protein
MIETTERSLIAVSAVVMHNPSITKNKTTIFIFAMAMNYLTHHDLHQFSQNHN